VNFVLWVSGLSISPPRKRVKRRLPFRAMLKPRTGYRQLLVSCSYSALTLSLEISQYHPQHSLFAASSTVSKGTESGHQCKVASAGSKASCRVQTRDLQGLLPMISAPKALRVFLATNIAGNKGTDFGIILAETTSFVCYSMVKVIATSASRLGNPLSLGISPSQTTHCEHFLYIVRIRLTWCDFSSSLV
jgi:hypothetical protein